MAGILLTFMEKGKLEIITEMCRQQKNHFHSKDCWESLPNMIVGIRKPYVKPIVRDMAQTKIDQNSVRNYRNEIYKRIFDDSNAENGRDPSLFSSN